uniref:Large ribosomal subunit protein uL29m n=1 Tax=Plectus sambesii TaxID=2011161 RepID=A0A914X1S4_9BILA
MHKLHRFARCCRQLSTMRRVPLLSTNEACSLHTSAVMQVSKGRIDEFFDSADNFGKNELPVKDRPGRSWSVAELRLKSSSDLHKLWYVLLKERNMLLTMEQAYKDAIRVFPNPERLDRVKDSMDNLEAVVRERNNALMELEYGESGATPTKTVTSFMGFKYESVFLFLSKTLSQFEHMQVEVSQRKGSHMRATILSQNGK